MIDSTVIRINLGLWKMAETCPGTSGRRLDWLASFATRRTPRSWPMHWGAGTTASSEMAAILLWNTVYLLRAIHALREHGISVDEGLVAHLGRLGAHQREGDYT